MSWNVVLAFVVTIATACIAAAGAILRSRRSTVPVSGESRGTRTLVLVLIPLSLLLLVSVLVLITLV